MKTHRGFVIVAACLTMSARSAVIPAGDVVRTEHPQSLVQPDQTADGSRQSGNRCWERNICPSHWSFSSTGVHFVGMEYAQFADGKWHQPASRTEAWVDEELKSVEKGERTILLAHSPARGKLVQQKRVTLGLFGDSHTEGRYFQPGSETPGIRYRASESSCSRYTSCGSEWFPQ